MVRATVHRELAPVQRVDLLLLAIIAAFCTAQIGFTGLSLWTIVTSVLAVIAAAVLVLSPVYSIQAYCRLRLSKPMASPQDGSVVVTELNGKLVMRPLQFRIDGEKKYPRFEHERRYYEAQADSVEKDQSFRFELVCCPTNLPLSTYLNRLTEKDVRNASKLLAYHGENKFDIPLPEIQKLVTEQALSPFFLFQVFCVVLWLLDEYWYFALFTLVMLIAFEFVVAQNRRKNVEVARQMLRPDFVVWVKRAGSWRRVSSSELVPLDVIAVMKDGNPFPCDALLVHGSCVVNEAMLTGESTPKMKDSVTSDREIDLKQPLQKNIEDSRFVLLGGTTVLDARRDIDSTDNLGELPDEAKAVAVVIRTGYETTQGSLMRMILHAGERVTVDSNREAYAFMFCLVVVATFAAGYVLIEGLKDPNRSQWKLFLHCIMIITSVVPPELPMELSLAVTTSLSNLIQKHAVYCTEPYRIPFAGMTDICCFDKTGTLTSDDLNVRHVVSADMTDLSEVPTVLEVLALCQSLVVVDDEIMGDTTETAAWRFLNRKFQIVPYVDIGLTKLRWLSSEYTIMKRFAFDSTLMRMSVLVHKSTPQEKHAFSILSKGAPEALQPLLRHVPERYEETYRALADKGYRVLCLARKELNFSPSALRTLPRTEAESGLEFLGFVALDSPLKADSEYVVNELRRSGHRVVIITGDSDATARDVGRRVNISEGGTMTGAEFDAIAANATNDMMYSRIKDFSIFARVSPSQKEKIIAVLSDAGLITLMCGDGTNDAGALKRAHVGVSVISHPGLERAARGEVNEFNELGVRIQLGDASIASPFTAKTPHISVILDIVRQGRCTLVTTIQMFRILAVNGLVHSITMTVLFLQGVRQGDTQSTLFGVIVAVVFALLSFTQPQKELTSRRPVSKIFSLPVILSIIGQSLIHLITLFATCGLVERDISEITDPDAEFKPNPINTVVYITGFVLQANIFAVNYRGHPFMTPFLENKRFSGMIFFMWIVAFILASGVSPEAILHSLELVVLPMEVHGRLMTFLLLDSIASFTWEHIVIRNILGG